MGRHPGDQSTRRCRHLGLSGRMSHPRRSLTALLWRRLGLSGRPPRWNRPIRRRRHRCLSRLRCHLHPYPWSLLGPSGRRHRSPVPGRCRHHRLGCRKSCLRRSRLGRRAGHGGRFRICRVRHRRSNRHRRHQDRSWTPVHRHPGRPTRWGRRGMRQRCRSMRHCRRRGRLRHRACHRPSLWGRLHQRGVGTAGLLVRVVPSVVIVVWVSVVADEVRFVVVPLA